MKTMRSCLVVFGVTSFLSGQSIAGVLDGADLSTHLYGPQVTEMDLRGKVVFVHYWGVRCPPCRASFPRLIEMQKKYAPTGRFTVFASHVQNESEDVRRFLAE